MLPQVLRGVQTASAAVKQMRIEDQAAARELENRRRHAARVSSIESLTRQRADRLEFEVQQWGRSKAIYEFLNYAERNGHKLRLSSAQLRQLRWAADLARHLDPFDPYEMQALTK